MHYQYQQISYSRDLLSTYRALVLVCRKNTDCINRNVADLTGAVSGSMQNPITYTEYILT